MEVVTISPAGEERRARKIARATVSGRSIRSTLYLAGLALRNASETVSRMTYALR